VEPVAMNLAEAIIVIAPGVPSKLIQELLGTGFLPGDTHFTVLLPPGKAGSYEELASFPEPARPASFLASPGGRFFSPRHLYWLWENLWTSPKNLLLVADSPYQNPATAVLVLSVLTLSGKEITLLFATPETVIDLTGQGFPERWLTRELNIRVLVKELGRLFWFLKPSYVMYFLMFGGLVVRKMLAEYLASFSGKSRLKRA
jgi:hypothetical protein